MRGVMMMMMMMTMHLFRACLVVICVASLLVVMPRDRGGRQRSEELFFGLGIPSAMASQEVDDNLVKQLWITCGLDPISIKEFVGRLDFSISKDAVQGAGELNPQRRLSMKVGLWETIGILSPNIKETLLDCLNKQDIQFHSPGGDDSLIDKYTKDLKSTLGFDPISRRKLAGQPVPIMTPTSAPTPSPAPAAAPLSVPSPGRQVEPPSYVPAPSSDPVLTSPPSRHGYFPVPSPMGIIPELRDSSPHKAPVLSSNMQNRHNNRSIVIAVAVTAAVTSLLVASFFYCYLKCCRNKNYSGNWQRDERPLLSLSLSDFSGSSYRSFGLGNSMTPEKVEALSFKPGAAQNGGVLSFEISSVQNPPSGVLSEISASSTEPSNAPSSAAAPPPTPPPSPPVMPQAKKAADPPPVPPPPVTSIKPGSQPPPPPKGAIPPRPPPTGPSSSRPRPSPLGPGRKGDSNNEANGPKTKLKPFFWDKVLANPDESMVWNQIKSGSFQFNEEMIESLFGYSSADKNKSEAKKQSTFNEPSTQYIHILDPKKSQNLAISIKALNVKIEEVCDALMEGNELPTELLETLLRMAPTADEELKLRLYCGEISQLGPAEQFLKSMVDIPFAFKRMDALLFMSSLQEDASEVKDSFSSLEVACKELRSSRLFLKLLEAVLKTGNRMNDGTFRGGAQAFKLDTLLKLSDVKGADGKTTLLHFVIQEIIRSEGMRAARMTRESGSISSLTTSSLNSIELTDDSPQESEEYYRHLGLKVVSGLSCELENVKKAASMDADALTSMVANFGHRLLKTREFLNKDMTSLEEESGFHHSLKIFVEHAEVETSFLLEEEKRIKSLVKSTTDYFHGNAGKDEGLRLFVVVRDFLGMLDKTCKQVRESANKAPRTSKDWDSSAMAPVPDSRQRLFPALRDRRMDSSSSDDEGP